MHITPERKKWFYLKIKRYKGDACWYYVGGDGPNGYGRFSIGKGLTALAHRASYAMHYGPIPPGLCVLHKCDNRRCVNPKHLFLGTIEDNNKDAARKGRMLKKLKSSDIKKIRNLSTQGLSQSEIGSMFGVSRNTIGYILRGVYSNHAS